MQLEETRNWVVMKFGGTSVSSADSWGTICDQAAERVSAGKHVLIVVSALSQMTNILTRLADGSEEREKEALCKGLKQRYLQLYAELGLQPSQRFQEYWRGLELLMGETGRHMEDRARAELLAHGELLSSSLGEQVLEAAGLQPAWHDVREILVATPESEDNVLAVRCDDHADTDLADRLEREAPVHITQGFLAADSAGQTCLLGRGGSDTSAAYLAARLSASDLEIWTDVPGIFSADPRSVPEARLLRSLGYLEAQELASMGAKVLHPPSIQPARRHGILIHIKDTNRPQEPGTRISARSPSEEAQVKGVVSRDDITVITLENPSMWRRAGFLADAFEVFKRHGYSVDLISTSESTVTVTLDPQVAAHYDRVRLDAFIQELETLCRVTTHTGCVSISLVGNAIRTILGRLSAALDVFQDRKVHLVTQSANDLNLTLVVDPEHALSLVRKLHQLLISARADNLPQFGPSWADLTRVSRAVEGEPPWWWEKSGRLLDLMANRDAAYVYDLTSVRAAARRLLAVNSVSRILYALKANDHPALLNALDAEGVGFECVSMNEVRHVLESVAGTSPADILFTPNFAPRSEYEQALECGVQLTLDNAWLVHNWPGLFSGQDVFLRLDLDAGYGHHRKVITSGSDSKFGISLAHVEGVLATLQAQGARVTGLHAHTGSGVINAAVWREQLQRFLDVLPAFPDVQVLDLGGGLGVPDRLSQAGFDLAELDSLLQETLGSTGVSLWLEPGRYLVAESGVLLTRVTQLKAKGQYRYLGVATGMNSLIRPALYGAYHDIYNLSRLGSEAESLYRVVGPICETGDVIGESRLLPKSEEGDVMLVANGGAYGRVMASSYNRRNPAEEIILG